jgi:hypothetical protein
MSERELAHPAVKGASGRTTRKGDRRDGIGCTLLPATNAGDTQESWTQSSDPGRPVVNDKTTGNVTGAERADTEGKMDVVEGSLHHRHRLRASQRGAIRNGGDARIGKGDTCRGIMSTEYEYHRRNVSI